MSIISFQNVETDLNIYYHENTMYKNPVTFPNSSSEKHDCPQKLIAMICSQQLFFFVFFRGMINYFKEYALQRVKKNKIQIGTIDQATQPT